MKRFRTLLPLVNLVLFLVVAASFIATHGGWKGDASYLDIDGGDAFFNRWRFWGSC
jgi:hypothetical protein